ncbi:hypothetical protein XA68_18440 [Ophiocordyceps unilateralis]|uniref:RRM domain-containing protein n=1 Tax=Ophiocordyceps unilateralis TaxID=268505 RepID=A0A2A9P354_OPHUN|nr:hypothetical protein XA68_18440 [Ophiocordyceps unilateralis]
MASTLKNRVSDAPHGIPSLTERQVAIMPRNEAPDNTIMRDVPPGDETGIYYIIISGLPFGTIWQLLKDWLRQAGCDVDHIEVFQKSTSGWVRLVGKHNFERALRHLQTVPYNNRLLLYLDKNRTESVKIMELIDDPPPKPKLGGGGSQASRGKSKFRAHLNVAPGGQAVGDHQEQGRPKAAVAAASTPVSHPPGPLPRPAVEAASPPLGCYYGASPELASMHDESRGQYGIMAEPFGPPSAWGLPYAPAYAPVYRPLEPPGSPVSSVRDHQQQQQQLLQQQDHHSGYRLLRYDPTGQRPSSRPSGWPSDASPRVLLHEPDDRCRVKIDPLRRGVTSADVEGWVRSIMGEWASALSRVDVVGKDQPPQRGGNRVRPYAYVAFLSSTAAKRAVELLNMKPLRGRSVMVRLVDEPDRGGGGGSSSSRELRALDAPPPSPPPSSSSVSQSELVVGHVSGSGPSSNKADAKNAPPVIAHGTFYRPKP